MGPGGPFGLEGLCHFSFSVGENGTSIVHKGRRRQWDIVGFSQLPVPNLQRRQLEASAREGRTRGVRLLSCLISPSLWRYRSRSGQSTHWKRTIQRLLGHPQRVRPSPRSTAEHFHPPREKLCPQSRHPPHPSPGPNRANPPSVCSTLPLRGHLCNRWRSLRPLVSLPSPSEAFPVHPRCSVIGPSCLLTANRYPAVWLGHISFLPPAGHGRNRVLHAGPTWVPAPAPQRTSPAPALPAQQRGRGRQVGVHVPAASACEGPSVSHGALWAPPVRFRPWGRCFPTLPSYLPNDNDDDELAAVV
ncbi:uncharacterized protein [Eulemur rufifrons]|uniref:uncharacterized protein isoform X2 n=1 Tax=Eulemur rufifrons TaxID=859984 RepID=UPI003743252E